MGKRVAFTKPQRAKLAKAVAEAVKNSLGLEIAFEQSELYPNELSATIVERFGAKARNQKYETALGTLSWFNMGIDEKGLDIHLAFDDVPRAVAKIGSYAMNAHSGKWNHYFWPNPAHEPDTHGEVMESLAFVLETLNGSR